MTPVEVINVAIDWVLWIGFNLTMLVLWLLVAMLVIISICEAVWAFIDGCRDGMNPSWENTQASAHGTRTSISRMADQEILNLVKAGVEQLQLQLRRTKTSTDKDVEKDGESKESLYCDEKEEEWLLM